MIARRNLRFLVGATLGVLAGVALAPFLAFGLWKGAYPAYSHALSVVAAGPDAVVVERVAMDGWMLSPEFSDPRAIEFAPEMGRRPDRRLELTVRIGDKQLAVDLPLRAQRQPPRFPLPFRLDATIECRFVASVSNDRIRVSRCLREQAFG